MELFPLFLSLILFISFILFFFSIAFKAKPTNEKLKLPPGSTGWPIIGETFEYISMARKNCIEKFISERQKKYQSKIFKTSYIGQTMVFMCTPEGNKFLFSNDNKLVKPWYPKTFDKIFGQSDNKLSESPEEITSIRKTVATFFSQPEALRKNLGIIEAIAKEHLQKFWDGKQEVVAHPLLKNFTFTLSCRLMLNVRDSGTIEELEKLFSCIMSGMISLPVNFPGTKFNQAVRASKEIRKKFEVMIRRRKMEIMENVSGSEDSSKDFLTLLIVQKLKDNEEVIESEVAVLILGNIVAAYDNSSTTLASILKYLAELPEFYEEVYREQMEVANSKGTEEALSLEDVKKMIYSWNVASEALRLQPTIASPFREAITDFNFDGYLIPKGWKLHRAVHATHKNSEYFPEPDKFDPSRFEGNKIVPYSYVPFGGGTHVCPGREYARLQILVFMHHLVKRFRWEKVFPDEQMIRDPILVPAKRLSIRLYSRQS
ncbi:hypothetical protein Pint_07755 [Pistacia integerrima]|uniref:Uncharacterized protein n=1 Tax=Pistacia integerrima TaxID=434235 RepID=A0ACC0XY06_9ROSI|nr:hypothetical protein Pint_07755 [Pistacia integerrima]